MPLSGDASFAPGVTGSRTHSAVALVLLSLSVSSPVRPMPRSPVDPREQCIGRRIREARIRAGMEQQKLAEKINVTYQQVWKIEKGVNRASPARLLDIADALDVPAAFLLDPNDGLAMTWVKLSAQDRDEVFALMQAMVQRKEGKDAASDRGTDNAS